MNNFFIYIFFLFFLVLYPMINAIFEFFQPVCPNLWINFDDKFFDFFLDSLLLYQSCEIQLLWNVVLFVICTEVEDVQIKSFGWSDRHMNLVSKECVLDEAWRIVVCQDHYNTTHHFSDLVIDETLTNYVESDKIFIEIADFEIDNIALRLGIFCLKIFRVIVKVMSTFEKITAFCQFLHQSLLLFRLQIYFQRSLSFFSLTLHYFFIRNKQCFGTDITIMPRFHHMTYLESTSNPLKAYISNRSPFEDTLELKMQSISIKRSIFKIILIGNMEQT